MRVKSVDCPAEFFNLVEDVGNYDNFYWLDRHVSLISLWSLQLLKVIEHMN